MPRRSTEKSVESPRKSREFLTTPGGTATPEQLTNHEAVREAVVEHAITVDSGSSDGKISHDEEDGKEKVRSLLCKLYDFKY